MYWQSGYIRIFMLKVIGQESCTKKKYFEIFKVLMKKKGPVKNIAPVKLSLINKNEMKIQTKAKGINFP